MKRLLFLALILGSALSLAHAQVGFNSSVACWGEMTGVSDTSGFADTSITSWSWDFDGDGLYDDGTGKTTSHIFPTSGVLPVGLKILFNNGSADSTTQNVQVNPAPEVNFYVDNLCENDSAVFTDNSSISSGSIVSYFWDFDDDGNADEVGQVAQYNHGVAGLYVTTLECVSDLGCSSFTAKQNQVYDQPVSDFESSHAMVGTSTYFTNTTFIPNGTIEIHVWDFGDGEGSSIEAPSHGFKTAQTYTVQLISISDQDCRDTMSKEITVMEAPGDVEELGVQSEVVTPNGDGFNDYLQVSALDDYTGCSVKIYNSWNDEIYSNDSYSNEESDSFTGNDQDAGAYYYIIQCDAEKPLMGVLNILK